MCAVVKTIDEEDVAITSIAYYANRIYYTVAAGDLASSQINSMDVKGSNTITLIRGASQGAIRSLIIHCITFSRVALACMFGSVESHYCFQFSFVLFV